MAILILKHHTYNITVWLRYNYHERAYRISWQDGDLFWDIIPQQFSIHDGFHTAYHWYDILKGRYIRQHANN